MSGQENKPAEGTVWERIQNARREMSLEKSGQMVIKGSRIRYATIDDLYKSVNSALGKQGLWLSTPLIDNAVHVRVVDVKTGKGEDLLAYPCVLTGQDVKKDAGTWTSCKRYAITSAFNLASGDEGGSEQMAVKEEERAQRGFVGRQRFRGVPDQELTRIRAALVKAGVTHPDEQRHRVSAIIGRPVTGRLSDARLTPAEADKLLATLGETGGLEAEAGGAR